MIPAVLSVLGGGGGGGWPAVAAGYNAEGKCWRGLSVCGGGQAGRLTAIETNVAACPLPCGKASTWCRLSFPGGRLDTAIIALSLASLGPSGIRGVAAIRLVRTVRLELIVAREPCARTHAKVCTQKHEFRWLALTRTRIALV